MESPICEQCIWENGGITLEILRVDNLKKVYGKVKMLYMHWMVSAFR